MLFKIDLGSLLLRPHFAIPLSGLYVLSELLLAGQFAGLVGAHEKLWAWIDFHNNYLYLALATQSVGIRTALPGKIAGIAVCYYK